MFSHFGKNKTVRNYLITVEEAERLPLKDGSLVFVQLKRGKKVYSTRTVTVTEGRCHFGDQLSFAATLYRKGNSGPFDPKAFNTLVISKDLKTPLQGIIDLAGCVPGSTSPLSEEYSAVHAVPLGGGAQGPMLRLRVISRDPSAWKLPDVSLQSEVAAAAEEEQRKARRARVRTRSGGGLQLGPAEETKEAQQQEKDGATSSPSAPRTPSAEPRSSVASPPSSEFQGLVPAEEEGEADPVTPPPSEDRTNSPTTGYTPERAFTAAPNASIVSPVRTGGAAAALVAPKHHQQPPQQQGTSSSSSNATLPSPAKLAVNSGGGEDGAGAGGIDGISGRLALSGTGSWRAANKPPKRRGFSQFAFDLPITDDGQGSQTEAAAPAPPASPTSPFLSDILAARATIHQIDEGSGSETED